MSLNYLSEDYDPTGHTDEDISAAQDRAIALLWKLKTKNENEYKKTIPQLYVASILACAFFPAIVYVYFLAQRIWNSENVYINYKTKVPVLISTIAVISQLCLIISLVISVFSVQSGASTIIYSYILSVATFGPILFLCMIQSAFRFKKECRKRDRLFSNKQPLLKSIKNKFTGFAKDTFNTIKQQTNHKE